MYLGNIFRHINLWCVVEACLYFM